MSDNSSLRPRIFRAVKFLLIVAVLALVVNRLKFAPVAVHGHEVVTGPIVAEVMGTGSLEARVRATISPKISGLVSKVFVDQGDQVSTGDLLVELDDEELIHQVEIAEADLKAKRAGIDRLVTDKNRETVVLMQATQLMKRIESALGSGAVSQNDMEKATESLGVAKAGFARAEAAIVEGEKELLTAMKTLEYQNARLANAKVLAPFDGLIVRRQREPGDIVLPGSPMLALISTEQLWVSAWVDETEMARVHPGQAARVVFRSVPELPCSGKVARLGRETDRETREFVVDVEVFETPKNWAVGQRAEVYIETGSKDSTLILPALFLRWRDNHPGVFVSNGKRVSWQMIDIGLRNDTQLEVLGGVKHGDVVVVPVKPKARLKDGSKVVIR